MGPWCIRRVCPECNDVQNVIGDAIWPFPKKGSHEVHSDDHVSPLKEGIQREKTGTFRGEGGWGGSEVRSDLGLQGYGRHHRMRRKKFYKSSTIIIIVPWERVCVFSLFLVRK